MCNIICFVPSEDTDKIAMQLYEKGKYAELGNIAYAISKSTLEKLAKEMADKDQYNGLMIIAPFLAD